MRARIRVAVATAAAIVALGSTARADSERHDSASHDSASHDSARHDSARHDTAVADFPGASYFIDGGALPLFWATGVTALSLQLFFDPPAEPRLFSASEGGKPMHGNTVAELWVGVYGGVAALGIGLLPDESRWYHLKGIAETLATTLAATETAKVTFGRHRPYWNETITNTDPDSRQSFFSGHASVSFATSTYLVLYLNGHVFAHYRELGQRFVWWETFPYLALEGGAALIAYSRLGDHRHHVSDVVTGSIVGAVTATALFVWQEHRFRDRKRQSRTSLVLSPDLADPGLIATWHW